MLSPFLSVYLSSLYLGTVNVNMSNIMSFHDTQFPELLYPTFTITILQFYKKQ